MVKVHVESQREDGEILEFTVTAVMKGRRKRMSHSDKGKEHQRKEHCRAEKEEKEENRGQRKCGVKNILPRYGKRGRIG